MPLCNQCTSTTPIPASFKCYDCGDYICREHRDDEFEYGIGDHLYVVCKECADLQRHRERPIVTGSYLAVIFYSCAFLTLAFAAFLQVVKWFIGEQ